MSDNVTAQNVGGGLTQVEAEKRLAAEGYNEIARPGPRNWAAIALEVIREPILLLLVAGTMIYLALGDVHEALVLGASVFVVAAISTYQEHKSERALAALRDLSSPRALVIRDGREARVPGREVVRGDLLVVREGDRIAADAVVIRTSNLCVDESVLTGESVAVRKELWDGRSQFTPPGGEGCGFIYAGTLAVQGHGVAEVVAIGSATAMGRIGQSLASISPEVTPLQRETRRAVRVLAIFAATLSLLLALLHFITRGNALDSLLAGITLAMAILPEEFPLVLTVFLALGAWRISKSRVLTRRIPAIEALGAATVLCVDKTGTLTLNRMVVKALAAHGTRHELDAESAPRLPASLQEVAQFAILASDPHASEPMERAIHALAGGLSAPTRDTLAHLALLQAYPISSSLLVQTHAWHDPETGAVTVAAKGAPEAIIDICALEDLTADSVLQQVSELASDGLRVLGVARATHATSSLPASVRDFDFEFVGLVGLADPVRPTVREALAHCYSAGVRVVMVTGDYPVTAQAIAREIGLRGSDAVMSGSELERVSDEELAARIGEVSIFSRVVPEQKLRIVDALKRQGDVVAMTGDGVNDAPALKAAHIGIAMGGRGTDVAREASTLVLLDDDFASIVRAIRLGRRIYTNIRNAVSYLLAVHTPTAGMAFIPFAFGWPLAFFPVHIVFFEFVIDPACSIVFEAEEGSDDLMKRPPRDPQERLFSLRTVALSALQGLAVLIAVAAIYGWGLTSHTVEAARSMAFVTIVLSNLGLILVNRSQVRTTAQMMRVPNAALWWVIGATMAGMLLTVYVPGLRELFRFAPLDPGAIVLCAGATACALVWFELYKWLRRPAASARTT